MDSDAGIGIKWKSGAYNDTNEGFLDPTSTYNNVTDAGETARVIAEKMREMGGYVVEHYPDLL